MTHAHPHHHASPPHHHASPGPDQQYGAGGQADILDLDAEVLAEHTASITAWLPVENAPRRIVDLGCGTGAGTFALLDRFPDAHVTAVDNSSEHLRRLRSKACARDVEERVRTVQADLDAVGWPDLGSPDLVWASASMHHMTYPDRVLRGVHDLLAPGGLFAVVELSGFPRFLPPSAPEDRPGLEERLHAVTDRMQAAHMPHRGADWAPLLADAGFTVEGHRTITATITGFGNAAVSRYALSGLQRLRGAVVEALSREDLAALDRLLDTDSPYSVLHRDDLTMRTERTVWAARRT
ncbi:class I SAM-dependent methyltransferase [Streptomyces sp. NPDC094143]|uniref:class I SAM-dependent methyltransferase n=1 Tax=Streptomyces sp. NPDC094143 TaxID=3155310 RepID=UPI00331C2C76